MAAVSPAIAFDLVYGGENQGIQYAGFLNDSEVVIVYQNKPYQHLYRFDLDSGVVEPMTDGARFDSIPVFSHDRTKLLFSSIDKSDEKREPESDLYTMNADGTELTRITNRPGPEWWPSFSPDASKVVYSGGGDSSDSERDLFLIDLPSGEVTQLTKDPETADLFPIWISNDEVLFSRADYYGHTSPIAASKWHDHVFQAINIETRTIRALEDKEHYRLESLRATQYGQHVLSSFGPGQRFVSPLSDVTKRIPLKGTSIEIEGTGTGFVNNYTYWEEIYLATPDGRSLIAMAKGEFIRIDVEKQEAVQFTNLRPVIVEEKRDPFSLLLNSVSPNGTKLLFLVDHKPYKGKDPFALWSINLDGSDAHEITIALP